MEPVGHKCSSLLTEIVKVPATLLQGTLWKVYVGWGGGGWELWFSKGCFWWGSWMQERIVLWITGQVFELQNLIWIHTCIAIALKWVIYCKNASDIRTFTMFPFHVCNGVLVSVPSFFVCLFKGSTRSWYLFTYSVHLPVLGCSKHN